MKYPKNFIICENCPADQLKAKKIGVSWLFFLFWSCVTDNLILKLSASVPVTYLVKIRIGDVFWESRNFELCFPSDLRFHFVRIKPLIQKLKRVIWCLWKRKFGSHRGYQHSFLAFCYFVFSSSISNLVLRIFLLTGTSKDTNMFNGPANLEILPKEKK